MNLVAVQPVMRYMAHAAGHELTRPHDGRQHQGKHPMHPCFLFSISAAGQAIAKG